MGEDAPESQGEHHEDTEWPSEDSDDDETDEGFIFAFPEAAFSNLCDTFRRKKFHDPVQESRPTASLSTIRLLKFEQVGDPSTPAEPEIQPETTYSLQNFKFGEQPRYAALSYVWGPEDAATDKSIVIDGSPRLVRSNLSRALEILTSPHTSTNHCCGDGIEYLWVDAICINQRDGKEKSNVVQHMGQIYAHAARVYSWLGPSQGMAESSGTLPNNRLVQERSCERVLSSLETLGELFWHHSGAGVQSLTDELLDVKETLGKCLDSLIAMFTNSFPIDDYATFSNLPYWSRIWVLQEVYQAQHLLFFGGSGGHFASKLVIGGVLLVEAFRRHLLAQDASPESLIKSSPALRRFALVNPASPEMHRLMLYTTIYYRSDMSLRIALTNFCMKELPHGPKATDPRDNVFGLLGFATREERRYVKANYELSLRDTYIEVTRSLIQQGFTDVLAWAQKANKTLDGLPSWVPDYASTIHDSLCSHSQAKPWLPHFNAGGLSPKYEFMVKTNTLFLSASYIDTIAIVGDIWNPPLHRPSNEAGEQINTAKTRFTSHSMLLSFLLRVKSLCNQAQKFRNRRPLNPPASHATRQAFRFNLEQELREWRSSSSLPQPPECRDSAWRVPCADQVLVEDRHERGHPKAKDMHAKLLDALPRCIKDPKQSIPAECRPYIEMLLRFVGKRVFVTETGYIGLGPGAAEKGDMVGVFSGVAAPYVARRFTVISGGTSNQLMVELVGEAYVDGLMDNEAAEAPRRAVGVV